jgi:uncharacterized protein (TIGR02466 family)
MSLIGRQFKCENSFGPYIVKTTISDELHGILLNTANKIRKSKKLKKENDYRNRLAGNLKEEYSYEGVFTPEQDKIVEEEFLWLASQYTKLSKQVLGFDLGRDPKHLVLHRPVWVNFMKPGEWNPSHSHSGDISCVAYLKVPPEIEKENTTADHTKNSNTPSAGRIEFKYGESIGYTKTGIIQKPVEKNIFLFPAGLNHMVYPWKGKSERISVSVNFADRIKSARNLRLK